LNEASPLLSKVVDIRRNALGENHPDYIASLEHLALLQWQKKEIDEAYKLFKQVLDKDMELVRTFFPSMSEREKGKFWDKLGQSSNALIRLLWLPCKPIRKYWAICTTTSWLQKPYC
jgi:hypothetical protein